jgi:hypothetical protein
VQEEDDMTARNTLWALPLLSILAMPAMADGRHDDGYRHDRLEQRLDRQHWRIKQGVRSGELTRKEAKRLRKQQRHIARMENRFARDGHLDRHERRTLRRELDAASDRIYRLKHNDSYRGRYADGKHGHGAPNGRRGSHHRPHRDGLDERYASGSWSIMFSLLDRL